MSFLVFHTVSLNVRGDEMFPTNWTYFFFFLQLLDLNHVVSDLLIICVYILPQGKRFIVFFATKAATEERKKRKNKST